MNSRFFLFIIFICSLEISPSFSQYVSTGEEPTGIKWKEIETRYFKLVFDEKFENQAQKVASYLDYSIEMVGDYHFIPYKKLPIIIHNHSVISNGMVAWAPRRMELYTVPPQDMYAHGWFEQLAVHEGRHVAQMYRLHQGVTNVFTYIFGEQGIAPSLGQLHPWFMEGDAVVTETSLTNSGRGRLPSFQMGYRSILTEKEQRYSFRKAVFGSYKDYVPNHYELGYMMVAYNRVKYNPQLWNYTEDRIAKKGLFATNPFRRAVKKYTGFNRTQLYNNTFNYYQDFWKKQADSIPMSNFTTINKRKNKSYASYFSPVFFEDKIYALKKSLDEVPEIVEIDPLNGTEKLIHTPGAIFSERIQTQQGKIYWEEYKSDLRWPQRNFSEIKVLDIKTGKTKNLTTKSRYLAPSVSPNGNMIAVTETNIEGINSLVILSEKDGSELRKIAVPENAAIQLPSWNQSSTSIVMTRVDEKGKSLVEYNLNTNNWKTIIPASNINLSAPIYNGNFIFYQGSYSGIENIYCINTLSSKIAQITSVKNGAFYPFLKANADSLFFSNYTSNGFDISIQGVEPEKLNFIEQVPIFLDPIAEKISSQEPKRFNYKDIETKNYEVKPYNKLSHLVNVHSWIPGYTYNNPEGPTNTISMIGVTAYSQNLQNTMFIKAGSGFYKGRSFSDVNFTYKGLFPVLSANIFYGDSINYINDRERIASTARLFQFDGSMSFPLDFSEGNKRIYFEPAVFYRYENRFYLTSNSYARQGLNKYALQASFVFYKSITNKHLAPRLGFTAFYRYQSPFYTQYFSPAQIVSAKLFLPGILKHHSIKLTASFEYHNLKKYFNGSMIGSLRGLYDKTNYELSHLRQMQVYSADYMMPILYPDLTVLKVLYFKRIKSTIFYDHAFARVYDNKNFLFYNKQFNSKGIDITTDYHLFFLPFEISMGARFSFVNVGNNMVSEFLFGINL